MKLIHSVIGWAIVIGFGTLWLWGMGALVFRRVPGRRYWWLLAFLQGSVLIQALAGVVLLLLGGREDALHYVYGVIFPVLLLLVAHVLAREQFSHKPWLPFAVAAFFCLGLTLRALTTGLEWPR
ncbi:MAG: hypothetical protein M3124_08090 [Actinomycetota bacterium]|nr:hypothetical protein [Actinomycetota bacterium]